MVDPNPTHTAALQAPRGTDILGYPGGKRTGSGHDLRFPDTVRKIAPPVSFVFNKEAISNAPGAERHSVNRE